MQPGQSGRTCPQLMCEIMSSKPLVIDCTSPIMSSSPLLPPPGSTATHHCKTPYGSMETTPCPHAVSSQACDRWNMTHGKNVGGGYAPRAPTARSPPGGPTEPKALPAPMPRPPGARFKPPSSVLNCDPRSEGRLPVMVLPKPAAMSNAPPTADGCCLSGPGVSPRVIPFEPPDPLSPGLPPSRVESAAHTTDAPQFRFHARTVGMS